MVRPSERAPYCRNWLYIVEGGSFLSLLRSPSCGAHSGSDKPLSRVGDHHRLFLHVAVFVEAVGGSSDRVEQTEV